MAKRNINTTKQRKPGTWKLICAGIAVLAGLGGLSGETIPVCIFLFVVAAALVFWWLKSTGRLNKANNTAAYTPAPTADTKKKEPEYDYVIPSKVDGSPKAYMYTLPIEVTNAAPILRAAEKGAWEWEAELVDGAANIIADGEVVGVLRERIDMLTDWIKRGDPYKVVMHNYNTETGEGDIVLAFYRDKQKANSFREQSVVPLTGYKSNAKQERLLFMDVGDEVDLEPDFDHEGGVIVYRVGDEIGKLPSKYAKRFLEEDAYAAFIESIDEDDDFCKRPTIRIYW